jgi:phospho-N-acetylmuramoyl-pentapeptide-transferase
VSALALALLCGLVPGWLLFLLYRTQIGNRMNQAFRDVGPESHKRKGRVPTGAGIVFVLACAGLAAWAWFSSSDVATAAIFAASALMGLLGFIDDRAKVKGGSAGLKARFKFPAMLICGATLLLVLRLDTLHHWQNAYYMDNWTMELPVPVYYLLGLFIWLGALNGSNFTDGLDGLHGSTSIPVLLLILLLFGMYPYGLSVAVFLGLILAFLLFNWKPARIYMGDSGSLCIGALVAGVFLSSIWWLFLGLLAIIWVLEVLSVMIQVVYYRVTKGKRLFLMTPVHHHFELAGWKEIHIVYLFTGFQAWGCFSAWLWLEQGLAWGLASSLLLLGSFIALVLRYNKRVA